MSNPSQTKINVLNDFEARHDDWSFGVFDDALAQAMGNAYGNYQTAKTTIIEADQAGRWPSTVKRYVLSNYRAFGNVPGEFSDIFNRLFSGLTEQEKKYWEPK